MWAYVADIIQTHIGVNNVGHATIWPMCPSGPSGASGQYCPSSPLFKGNSSLPSNSGSQELRRCSWLIVCQ